MVRSLAPPLPHAVPYCHLCNTATALMSLSEHLGPPVHTGPQITLSLSSRFPAPSTMETVSPSPCACARYHSGPEQPDATKERKKSPSFLVSESERAQRTKPFGDCSCQLLAGPGLMNAKTFQRLLNRTLSQKLFHRKSRRHIPAPTRYSRRDALLHNGNG